MTLRRLALALSSLSLAAVVGCAPTGNEAPVTDEEAPLSSLSEIIAEAPDNATLAEEGKADEVYPATFDLIGDQTPIRNQASRGVCSIFAAVALVENLYKREGTLENPDFSEQWLQWSVKEQVRAFRTSEGSSANRNIEAVVRFGIPEESVWPYETTPWNTSQNPGCTGENRPTICYTNGEPTEEMRMATLYRLPAGRYINASARSIKAHMMAKRTGVIAGGTFYYQAWNHGRSTLPTNGDYFAKGYVLAPNSADRTASREQPAGHEFLLIGWDDNLEVQKVDAEGKPMVDAQGNPVMQRGFFLFKNSWGTGRFGTQNRFGAGYGWIAYDYVKELSAYVADLPAPPPVPEVCGDGRDNDRDGKTDCSDTDCAAVEACMQSGGETSLDESTERRNIPDNNTTGVASEITVAAGGNIHEVIVHANITHTYRGDLILKLVHPSGQEVVLVENEGGSQDNINTDFVVGDFEGLSAAGTWKLVVVDTARQDTGRLDSWSLLITRSAN